MENNQTKLELIDSLIKLGEVIKIYRDMNKGYNGLVCDLANLVTMAATESFDNIPSRLLLEILEKHNGIIRGLNERILEQVG